MSEKRATTYTVLHLRFKLRVPPDVLLAKSREAATIIASVEGLIWKIWVLQQEELEMGGIYLFANRETAEAYLNHPVIQAVRSNPADRSDRRWGRESLHPFVHNQARKKVSLLRLAASPYGL